MSSNQQHSGNHLAKSFDKSREDLSVGAERVVLVGVALSDRPFRTPHDPLEELRGLAESAGAEVVGELTQKRPDIHSGSYIGAGKLSELAGLVEATDADTVIFDNDLSPGQVRNLESGSKAKVIDRSELILDIFATRARTPQARLQVELAQLEYAMPRLKRMWTHLSRERGGIGLRGPGETQIETDRRLIGSRIRDLKAKLLVVEKRKEREVLSRREQFTVSLVGYTNAGKSHLMSALTKSDIYVADKLFSTLETRTRQWHLKDFGQVLLSDTVGFIRDLPHHLVESFKATLEEARQARLLLHVVDASDPAAEEHIKAVKDVLTELNCHEKPSILVLNKIDKLTDPSLLDVLTYHHPNAVPISALIGEGLDKLRDAVIEQLTDDFIDTEILADAANGRVLSFLGAHAEIYRQQYEEGLIRLRCFLPKHLMRHIESECVEVRVLGEAS